MTDFDEADIRAMRRQGDLRAFLRQQAAEGRARRDAAPPQAGPQPPGHRPGAWPAGTRPPAPPPRPPGPAECAAALDDYRRWRDAGRNPRDTGPPCPCPACRQLANTRTEEDQ